jgi:hypothetical protein
VPFILRTIRRGRWLANKPSETHEERFARALNDLPLSKDNKLSVWHVEYDYSNLERLVTALGANRDHLDNIDYILLDDQWLLELDIQCQQSEGKTPDQEVNRRWHFDLVEISANKHEDLTKVLLEQGHINRILPKQILELISQAIESGNIDVERLKPGIRSKIVARRLNLPGSSDTEEN